MKKLIITAAILSTVAFSSYTKQNVQQQQQSGALANNESITTNSLGSEIAAPAPTPAAKADLGQADGNP
jgi:peptidoglycan hydrolase CwlO-like protein